MGIFHFFGWFKKQFSGNIHKLADKKNFSDINISIDNLMIDMNGLFHESTQKIYQYGNHKSTRLLPVSKYINKTKQQIRVFEDVCKNIEHLLNLVKPNKRLILCVDGPAPYAKQVQQKKRRFKSAFERKEDDNSFDSNEISPGTKFMDNLSKYIDWFLRKKISENPDWKNIEIIFSNEKVPGEGEHKILSYIRKYGNKDEKYCIQGADADLIMLALGTHLPNFYILREDTYDIYNKYFVIDINNVSWQLAEIMRWESDKYEYIEKNAIDDFIFMCFMVGNDFLPHIPSLEIIESGIDILLDIYRQVCPTNGHIITNKNENYSFNKNCLKKFFEVVGTYEKIILENKLKNRRFYFPDPLLEECSIISEDSINVDLEKYRKEYCKKYLQKNIEKNCHEYLDGLCWVISYYKKGVPEWKWYYPYNYAPPATELAKYIDTFNFPKFNNKYEPLLPFQQLLAIMPPKSSNLLPEPLDKLISDEKSPIKEFYPDDFEIDLAGKKNEWQGIVLIPIAKPNIITQNYFLNSKIINEYELKRNILGKSFVYKHDINKSTFFKSFYGNINICKVQNMIISL